jgi:hypothetical protein
MSNRHKSKSNHPKPINKLIDNGSKSYSPNSIGGRIDLQALRDKLFCNEINEINETNHQRNHATDSKESLQGKGEKK